MGPTTFSGLKDTMMVIMACMIVLSKRSVYFNKKDVHVLMMIAGKV